MKKLRKDDFVQKQKFQFHMNQDVYTRHGTGKIVHEFPDGTLCVQLEHGGGMIVFPEEIVPRHVRVEVPVSPNYQPRPMAVLSA